ncbi:hypothetical protein [Acetobacterium wieringae]|uniref:hypothetical protein n=1 Tax=Acetobacterium wieringae TaxID=52694 RepID=UPI002033CBDB|nr:hypothetical protein [Acetobacterium wieringae]URN84995.1 hypothetical protein CHL1_000609 [Acetobacterium wieringae]
MSIDALFGNVLASWLFYNKFTNTIMHLWQNGSNYYIRHVNENKEVLFSFSIGSITYGITCVNYGDYAFVFDVNGWKKYSSTGTLLSSGSDFKIDSAFNTSYQRILILESAGVLIGVQPDKSVKWFDLSTSAVIKTLTFSDLVSGYPFRDKYGNWYYEITGGYYKKVNSDGNIVFSQSLGTRLNQNNGNYPVCLLDDLDMFFQTYMTSPPNYFYAKALSMVDGSIIYNTATYNANITYSAQFAKVSNNGKLVILSQLQSQNSVVCMEITEAGVVDYNTFKNISSLGGGGYAPVTAHSIPSYTFADDKLFFCGYLSAASVYLICVVNLGYYLD